MNQGRSKGTRALRHEVLDTNVSSWHETDANALLNLGQLVEGKLTSLPETYFVRL